MLHGRCEQKHLGITNTEDRADHIESTPTSKIASCKCASESVIPLSVKLETRPCPLCKQISEAQHQLEYGWAAPEVKKRLAATHAHLDVEDGACPACVQQALLEVLLNTPDDKLHETIQSAWPLDVEAAFGALPIPLRMHADPNFAGRGVTLAMIDSGFFPHPDLCRPTNRIKAWANAAKDPVEEVRFGKTDTPRWPM
jgi:hypothetical protein